jgi:cation diffusion facilitator family transporter
MRAPSPTHDRSQPTLVIFAALAGNLGIAVAKLVAFVFTGSSAILTEAVHSLVDTGNQGLMFLGLRRGARPPDETHPFGYGMEVYFWTFVVALMIFALGGAVSIWEGVEKIRHPAEIAKPWINYAVLGVAVLFEAASFTVALREFNRMRRSRGLITAIRRSKDPTVFAVLLEDAAALAGLVIAAVGLSGAVFLHWRWADGAASCVIGLLLVLVAAFLANETRSLLTGEGASARVVAAIHEALRREPDIAAVSAVRSLHVGPSRILVALSVRFADELDREALDRAVDEVSSRIGEVDDRIVEVFLQPDVKPG